MRGTAAAAIVAGMAILAAATAGMLAGQEPFATWYYPFAWFATLLAADGVTALRTGRFRLVGRPAHLGTMLLWSVVVWLIFEILNLRLSNWYYVFVPPDPLGRWVGTLLSFATVLPAVFLSEALLAANGVGERMRARPLRPSADVLRALPIAGIVLLTLPMVWPRAFFPLVWIAPTLLLDPWNHARDPARSLLGDLERGRPGRPLRLLLGGAAIGLLWELFNSRARAKWIYTVPGLEELKLFEMPLAGFLGFPPFALVCFAAWQSLVLAGLAVPRAGAARPASAGARVGAAALATLLSAAALVGMERHTVSSLSPSLEDVPGAPARTLRARGHDVWSLAEASPEPLAAQLGTDRRAAAAWVERARLVTLRGIGGENARRLVTAGVRSVQELARADPARLAARLEAGDEAVPVARVRVWVRAARRAALDPSLLPERRP